MWFLMGLIESTIQLVSINKIYSKCVFFVYRCEYDVAYMACRSVKEQGRLLDVMTNVALVRGFPKFNEYLHIWSTSVK